MAFLIPYILLLYIPLHHREWEEKNWNKQEKKMYGEHVHCAIIFFGAIGMG